MSPLRLSDRLPDDDPAGRGPDQRPFKPAWGLRNAHLQTIVPALVRRPARFPFTTEVWPSDDGEAVDMDLLPHEPGQPGVLVLHGLEGSSRARYVRGLMAAIWRRGWNGAAMNFRSCGPTPVRGPRLYHSGDTRDLPLVVGRLRRRWPHSPLAAVGFSMGGNALLQWLSQGAHPLRAAVAISAPYDLAACVQTLDAPGLMARLYRNRLLHPLIDKARAVEARHPRTIDLVALNACRTFAHYDEVVTAPLFGFKDAQDYWARCSCGVRLGSVTCPTLLVSALDDPMIPARSVPIDPAAGNPYLVAQHAPRGGHVGFVSGWPFAFRYDAEDRALEFVAQTFSVT